MINYTITEKQMKELAKDDEGNVLFKGEICY